MLASNCSCAAGVAVLFGKSNKRAPGPHSDPWRQSTVLWTARSNSSAGSSAPLWWPTSGPTAPLIIASSLASVSSTRVGFAGGKLQWRDLLCVDQRRATGVARTQHSICGLILFHERQHL